MSIYSYACILIETCIFITVIILLFLFFVPEYLVSDESPTQLIVRTPTARSPCLKLMIWPVFEQSTIDQPASQSVKTTVYFLWFLLLVPFVIIIGLRIILNNQKNATYGIEVSAIG